MLAAKHKYWRRLIEDIKIKSSRLPTLDPHHCRCFSVSRAYLWNFETAMKSLGYHEPMLEEDHGQYCSFAKRLSEFTQIHIKVKTTGSLEAEIEPPQDYPGAHLNSIHSYSAHKQLQSQLSVLGIPFKCRRTIPLTCINPQIVSPVQPTHRNDLLGLTAVVALADLAFNDGDFTRRGIGYVADKASDIREKKMKRRRRLYQQMGWHFFPYF